MNRNFNPTGPPRGGQYSSPGSGSGDMMIQRDTIFIQNLPKNVTTDELSQSFGAIGIIKNDKRTGLPKIWIYKDKSSGEGKGEATVTYDDEAAAEAAINWFNGRLSFLLFFFKFELPSFK
jgi:RNA-binding protein FUS